VKKKGFEDCLYSNDRICFVDKILQVAELQLPESYLVFLLISCVLLFACQYL